MEFVLLSGASESVDSNSSWMGFYNLFLTNGSGNNACIRLWTPHVYRS